MLNKITPYVAKNYWLKSLDTARLEGTILSNLIEVPKVFEPNNKMAIKLWVTV